jgi:hypothetical protein
MQESATALRCSNGAGCVAYPALGEPAKLSRGNPGPRCFACEERRVAAELEAVAACSRDEQHRKANRSRPGKRDKPEERTCTKRPCERPVAERDGAAVVCREHAEASRAAKARDRRIAWVLTCERAVRSAIASDDEHSERRWAKLLLAAEVSLAEAEAELRVAEIKARPTRQNGGPSASPQRATERSQIE